MAKTIEFLQGGMFEDEYFLKLLKASFECEAVSTLSAKKFIEVIRPMIESRRVGYDLSIDAAIEAMRENY